MSKYVDQRVVEMDFDNKRFEKNVSQSMSTLDKLKEKLDFSSISKQKIDTNPITSAVAKISNSFSAMEIAAITAISNITNRITNMAVEFTKSLTIDNVASGWSKYAQETTAVGTLMAQTIRMTTDELDENGKAIVKVVDEADKMSVIEEQLEKLNWYTDETSYTFTDMVDNIGKFTAAGNSLNDSVDAMMGIANWAALSGQNAQTASRAMYQLSQAMSSGTVRLQDYKSIQTANMDTEEFRKTVLDTALELGTLQQSISGMYLVGDKKFTQGQFTEYLSEGWFTSDVLLKALKKYNAATDELYAAYSDPENAKTTSELIEEMADRLDKFGLKAFQAAQEARTFEDAIGSVKEGVASGWMNIFNTIFGNYEEAKTLWTDLANTLYDIFVEPLGKVIDLVKEWKELGGREDLFGRIDKEGNGVQGALWNLLEAVQLILDTIREAWRSVFPPKTAESLKTFTEFLRDSTAKWLENKKWAEQLRTVLTGIFSLVKLIKNFIGAIWRGLKPIRDFVNQVLVKILTKVTEYSTKLSEAAAGSNQFAIVTERLTDISSRLVSIIKKIYGIISKVLSYIFRTNETGDKSTSIFSKLGDILWNVTATLLKFIESTIDFVSSNEAIKALFKGLLDFLVSLPEKISNAATSIWNFLTANEEFSKVLETLWDLCKKIWEFLLSLPGKIDDVVKSLTGGKGVLDILASAGRKVADVFASVIGFFRDLFSGESESGDISDGGPRKTIGTASMIAKDISESGAKAAKNVSKKSTWRDTLMRFFTSLLTFLEGLVTVIQAIIDIVSTVLQLVGELLKFVGTELKTIFSGDFKVLKTITKILLIIGGIALVVTAVYNAVWYLSMIFGKSKMFVNETFDALIGVLEATRWKMLSEALLNFGKVLIIFVGVILVLGNIPWQQLLKGGLALLAGIGIIVGLMFLITKVFMKSDSTFVMANTALQHISKRFGAFQADLRGLQNALDFKLRMDSISYMLRSIGVILLTLAASLAVVANIPADQVWRAVGVLSVLMLAVSAMVVIIDRFYKGAGTQAKGLKKTSVFAILAAAAAVRMLAKPLKEITSIFKVVDGNVDTSAAWSAVGIIVVLLSTIMLLSGFVAKIMQDVKPGAILALTPLIIAMSIMLSSISNQISKLAALDLSAGELWAIGAIFMAVIAVIGTVIAVISKVGIGDKNGGAAKMLSIGAAFILMSVSVAILAGAFKMIADCDWKQLLIGAGILIGVIAVFAGLSILVEKLNLANAMLAFSGAIAILAASALMFAGALKLLSTIGPEGAENLKRLLLSLLGLVPTICEAIANGFVTIVTALATSLGKIIAALFASFGDIMSQIAAGLGPLLQGVIDILRINANSIVELVVMLISMLCDIVIQSAPKLAEALVVVMTSLMGALMNHWPEIRSYLQYMLTDVLELLMWLLEELPKYVVRIVQVLWDLTVAIWDGFTSHTIDMVNMFFKFIRDFLDTLAANFGPTGKSITNFVLEYIKTVLKMGIDLIVGSVNLYVTGIINLFNGIADAIEQHTQDLVNAFHRVWTAVWKAFLAFFGIHSPSKKFSEAGGSMIQGLINGIKSAGANLWNGVKSVFGNLWSGIQNVFSGAVDFGRNIVNNIKNGIQSAGNWIQETATNIGTGFVNGIQSTAGAVKNAAENVASWFQGTFNNLFGIHSPSKYMMEEGKFIDEGLAEGIDNNTDVVEDSTKSLGATIKDKFSNIKTIALEKLGLGDIGESLTGSFGGGLNLKDLLGGDIDSGGFDLGNMLGDTLAAMQDLEDSDLEIDVGVNFIPNLSSYDDAVDDIKAPSIEDINSGTYENAAAASSDIAFRKASSAGAIESNTSDSAAVPTANTENINNTYYISGNNPKEIADEVSKIIQKQIDRRKAVWAT